MNHLLGDLPVDHLFEPLDILIKKKLMVEIVNLILVIN